MTTRFGRGHVGSTGRLEVELRLWLRGFEGGPMPVAARLRISADLRAEASHPVRLWARLPRLVSSAASVAVVLAWAVLFLLAVTSMNTASYGPGAPTGPEPINPPTPDLSSPGLLADPLGLALILVASVLAGAASTLRIVRSAAGRVVLGAGRAVTAPPIPLRRRIRTVPWLALVLALLPVMNVVLQPYPNHPLMPAYSISMFLPSALACAIAFRYPAGDRSVRWLLVGGFCVGLAQAVFGVTNWTLGAIGWLALAVGLAARTGAANRPRWFLVAAATGVAIYVHANVVIDMAASYSPVDYVLPALVSQAAAECMISFAWMAIIWTAFTCLRRGGGAAWALIVAAAGGLLGLQLYQALGWNTGLTLWLMDWMDHETLMNALLAVEWLSFGALLAALLIGLRPAASEGAPRTDSEKGPEIATP